jgi:hypothetical protein
MFICQFQANAYIQYVPPAMAAVNWCNLNPHNCVRTLTNGWQNILDTVDHKAEAIRKQAMFENLYSIQHQQLTQLNKAIPVDPWNTLQQFK